MRQQQVKETIRTPADSRRRLGANKNAVEALLRTLENMKYQIRTALGISTEEYSNLQDWVLGTFQGSGASPVSG